MSGKFPSTFYRVAVKAQIKNSDGQLLLVKENSDKWDLPGGGVDHGETPEDAMRREIQEEIGISKGIQIGRVLDLKSFWIETKQTWLMWIIYDVTLPSDATPTPGEGVTDIAFVDPRSLSKSSDERERHISLIRA